MVVATLTIQHGIDVRNQHQTPTGMFLATGPGDRVRHLVILLSAVLIVLAAINAIFTSWATAIDAERSTALARALGATPRQISACLTTAQLLPGAAAACLGIPAGLAVYAAAGGHLGRSAPPILWLIAVIPGTLLVVAALTALPARIVATRPVADVLRAE
jgi:putative ABC transport system permease protein